MKNAVLGLLLCTAGANAADLALDVGHSIRHPGATAASGIAELDLNRALAQEIAAKAEGLGLSHHLIGVDGKMDVLTERTRAANGDTLFLSIHHDSIPREWFWRVRQFSGYALFVSHKNPHLAASLACAKQIGAELLIAGFRPSRYHALPVRGQNRPYADEARGVHYFDDLVVLKTARQPAVLIEAGVIVNPEDEHKITGNAGRARFADAVARAAGRCVPNPHANPFGASEAP